MCVCVCVWGCVTNISIMFSSEESADALARASQLIKVCLREVGICVCGGWVF